MASEALYRDLSEFIRYTEKLERILNRAGALNLDRGGLFNNVYDGDRHGPTRQVENATHFAGHYCLRCENNPDIRDTLLFIATKEFYDSLLESFTDEVPPSDVSFMLVDQISDDDGNQDSTDNKRYYPHGLAPGRVPTIVGLGEPWLHAANRADQYKGRVIPWPELDAWNGAEELRMAFRRQG